MIKKPKINKHTLKQSDTMKIQLKIKYCCTLILNLLVKKLLWSFSPESAIPLLRSKRVTTYFEWVIFVVTTDSYYTISKRALFLTITEDRTQITVPVMYIWEITRLFMNLVLESKFHHNIIISKISVFLAVSFKF